MNVVKEATVFDAPIRFNKTPQESLGIFPSAGATPTVSNTRYWSYAGSAVTITNFLGGNAVHTLFILGNANLTISNNANIKTNTGANKTLVANKVYTFHKFNSVWYEVD